MQIIVNNELDRIDKYLTKQLNYSRSFINKMIDNGSILVNGLTIKPSYKVNNNDIIEIKEFKEEPSDLLPVQMNLEIIYEDNDIIIINKPSGLVVHPGNGNKDNTLVNGLLYYTNNLSDVDEERPGIVHRLDKDTSGIMITAKNSNAHRILTDKFSRHEIKREYIALLNGVVPHQKIKIDAPIGRDTKDRKKMAVTSNNSKKAVTYLEVLKTYHNHTLVKLNLETGRTHQIRVHTNYIGYPVFNDPVYSKQVIKEYGQFLHSKTIDFIHPITNEKMHFECDLPKYFQDYLDTLE